MKKTSNQLVLVKEDYDFLKSYIRSSSNSNSSESSNAAQLAKELTAGAVLVNAQDFPLDGIRLNSRVTVEDKATGRKLKVKLVMPQYADLKEGKISVLAPLGTALIGYRKGQLVTWQMPVGEKIFSIIEVSNAEA